MPKLGSLLRARVRVRVRARVRVLSVPRLGCPVGTRRAAARRGLITRTRTRTRTRTLTLALTLTLTLTPTLTLTLTLTLTRLCRAPCKRRVPAGHGPTGLRVLSAEARAPPHEARRSRRTEEAEEEVRMLYVWEGQTRHTRVAFVTRGMRGSKPAGLNNKNKNTNKKTAGQRSSALFIYRTSSGKCY